MRTKVFKSGNSQAVRIPANIAYADMATELEITRTGDEITIRPAQAVASMKAAFEQLNRMPKPATVELVERTVGRDTRDDV